MIAGLPLGFAQPLVLLALLSLPVLWWLLRLIPPQPRRINFPPTRLLFDIAPREETPARTPWWLTLLRLTLAALVIIAAAGPLWNPPVATSTAKAPLVLLIDDGFPAAGTWDARMRTAEDLVARAEADNRAAESGTVRALDLKGLPLGDASFAFKDGERETDAELTLPVEIRNDIARLEIAGERSAGAVQLLDKRWRRRSIGVVTGATSETAQPLLDATYYLSR